MPNVKVSDLSSASTPLTGSELVPIVQSGTTFKTTTQDIADLVSGSYKTYVAKISQFGTSAPTVDYLLQNNLTNPVTFSYDSVGIYKINCLDFDTPTTVAIFQQGSGSSGATFQLPASTGYVSIIATNSSGSFANGLFSYSTVEIRVYP
jgi:hypothetical protein